MLDPEKLFFFLKFDFLCQFFLFLFYFFLKSVFLWNFAFQLFQNASHLGFFSHFCLAFFFCMTFMKTPSSLSLSLSHHIFPFHNFHELTFKKIYKSFLFIFFFFFFFSSFFLCKYLPKFLFKFCLYAFIVREEHSKSSFNKSDMKYLKIVSKKSNVLKCWIGFKLWLWLT